MLVLYDKLDSPQYLNYMSDYLRYVYSRSKGLEDKQRKQLVKDCLKCKLQQHVKVVGGNVDISKLLRRLTTLFGAVYGGKGLLSNSLHNADNNFANPPKRTKAKINSDQIDEEQTSLQRLIEMFIKSPSSSSVNTFSELKDSELKNPEQTLEEIFSTLSSLQKRFSKTGAPLLEMLKRIDKVLVASDNSIKEATQASFDLIIDSFDPAVFGQAVDRSKYRTKKAYRGELYELYTEKHLQLKQYHEQGRFVKDCRAIYREKMKKYGL